MCSDILRSLNLLKASDKEIFLAKDANAVILTKDQDFYQLLAQFGPPPQIIWLTCGNTSTHHLCKLLESALPVTLNLLKKGEPIVEIH
jgi:predicted nuclease of predicted toxin-antitoxin system